MENISRPRSLAKMAAVAAIALFVVGCVAALAIGVRQRKTATDEANNVRALVAQAKAQLSQATALNEEARATLDSAASALTATIENIQASVSLLLSQARAQELVDYTPPQPDIPPFGDHTKEYAHYAHRAETLKLEIANKLDRDTMEPLTEAELTTKQEELHQTERRVADLATTIQQGFDVFIKSLRSTTTLDPACPTPDAIKQGGR